MKVLHVLDYSLRSRQAGYTIRSKYIFDTQRALGLEPIVATRFKDAPLMDRTCLIEEEYVDGVLYLNDMTQASLDQHFKSLGLLQTRYSKTLHRQGLQRQFQNHIARVVEVHKPEVIHVASPAQNVLISAEVGRKYSLPVIYEVRGLWHDTGVVSGLLNTSSAETFLRMKSAGGIVIGTAGFLRPIKGFHILLQAYGRIVKAHPGTCLLVVGRFAQESYKREMLRQISDMGIKRHVVFTGYIPHRDVLAWLREMDIFVFPSLHEGSPNALLEAMACELPVVASQVGGILDIVEDNRDGLLVLADDVNMLSQKLERLVQDRDLRKRLGKAARQKIENQFSPARETEMWLDIYYRVLSGSM